MKERPMLFTLPLEQIIRELSLALACIKFALAIIDFKNAQSRNHRRYFIYEGKPVKPQEKSNRHGPAKKGRGGKIQRW